MADRASDRTADGTAQPAAIRLGGNAIYALRLAAGPEERRMLLVDAGPDFEGAWESAVEQAAGHGFAPSDVRTVLLTHGHIDHAGLAHRWAEAGATVRVGAADLPALTREGPRGEATRDARRDELLRHGCPEDVLMTTRPGRTARGPAARPQMRWTAPPAAAVEAVEDGATFALEGPAGQELRVVAAPGHTPGNLVALVEGGGTAGEAGGDLYSGDTLLPGTIPTPGLHFPDGGSGPRWPSLPRFIESVTALSALPVRRVLPGHGEPVDEPERLFARYLRHNERRQVRIVALLEERPDSAYGVARRLFPRLPDARLGQAMTEVLGQLDTLVESGAVTVDGAVEPPAFSPGG
ncbi:MAG: MBL fold metallo-hydrolase [Dehalococcoidia bacterium]